MPTSQHRYRPWQPGDGLSCRYARQAPVEMPCGRPTTTLETEQDSRPGGPRRVVVAPLCDNHAIAGANPHKVLLEARKIASQRLAMEHWETFSAYLKEAIEEVRERYRK